MSKTYTKDDFIGYEAGVISGTPSSACRELSPAVESGKHVEKLSVVIATVSDDAVKVWPDLGTGLDGKIWIPYDAITSWVPEDEE